MEIYEPAVVITLVSDVFPPFPSISMFITCKAPETKSSNHSPSDFA